MQPHESGGAVAGFDQDHGDLVAVVDGAAGKRRSLSHWGFLPIQGVSSPGRCAITGRATNVLSVRAFRAQSLTYGWGPDVSPRRSGLVSRPELVAHPLDMGGA